MKNIALIFLFLLSATMTIAQDYNGLPNGATITGTEVMPATQKGTTVKFTLNQISAFIGGGSGGTLAGLSDVSISSPSNNQVLLYSSGSSKWINSTFTGSQWTTTGSDIYYNTGNVMVGINASPVSVKLQTVETSTSAVRGVSFQQYSADGNSSILFIDKSRGTFGSGTAITSGDFLGNFTFRGYDGTNFTNAAEFLATSTGTISSGIVQATLKLRTANSIGVMSDALTVDGSQIVTLANALPIASGGTAVTSITTSPTASAFAGWDANKNLSANNFQSGYTSTATAAGTTTLTVSSTEYQYFTGSTTQIVTLPVTSTLSTNPQTTFTFVNLSSGSLTINSSGGNLVQTMTSNSILTVSCISTSGTTASSWNATYYPPNPMTAVGDLIVGSTIVNGAATPSRLAAGTLNYALLGQGSGVAPAYGQINSNIILATATNDNATAGNIGEQSTSTQSTYTNYTTTATYQNIASITLTAGDWDISANGTFSTNSSTITSTANTIFVISTTTASASGATEGVNIVYVPQSALVGTATKETVSIPTYRISISSTTTYYLNTQSTFTVGNPQFVGSIHAKRNR